MSAPILHCRPMPTASAGRLFVNNGSLTSLLPRPKPLTTSPSSLRGNGGSGPFSGPTTGSRGPSGLMLGCDVGASVRVFCTCCCCASVIIYPWLTSPMSVVAAGRASCRKLKWDMGSWQPSTYQTSMQLVQDKHAHYTQVKNARFEPHIIDANHHINPDVKKVRGSR